METFESVEPGWGPFVKGDAGGSFDARTHLSERHEPYTQAGWNGKTVDDVLAGNWSLKAHEERQGLIYRTVPQSARFEPGRAYEVSFGYQNAQAGTYQWVTGHDTGGASVEIRRTLIPERRVTTRFTERVVGGCGEVWVGLRSLRPEQAGADFILDDFAVTDLGPAQDGQACGTLDLAPVPAGFERGAARTTAGGRWSATVPTATRGAADGGPIVISGRTFDKGLGMYAPAKVRFHLGDRCTGFTAFVGVDMQVARGVGGVLRAGRGGRDGRRHMSQHSQLSGGKLA